jgi:hypothetical protein
VDVGVFVTERGSEGSHRCEPLALSMPPNNPTVYPRASDQRLDVCKGQFPVLVPSPW